MVSASEPDQISQFCLVKGALLDLIFVGGVQVQEAVVAAWKWSVFPMDHRFFGFSVQVPLGRLRWSGSPLGF